MVNNFKLVSVFSPLLASSKDLTDVYLKTAKMIVFDDTPYIHSRISSRTSCVDIMTRKDNDGQVVIRVHVQQGIFFALRRLGRICSVRDVCSRLLCQSIAIDERFLCGYRLIID